MATENLSAEEITRLAEIAAGELLEAHPTLREAFPVERSIAVHRASENKQSGAARLNRAINGDASFG